MGNIFNPFTTSVMRESDNQPCTQKISVTCIYCFIKLWLNQVHSDRNSRHLVQEIPCQLMFEGEKKLSEKKVSTVYVEIKYGEDARSQLYGSFGTCLETSSRVQVTAGLWCLFDILANFLFTWFSEWCV